MKLKSKQQSSLRCLHFYEAQLYSQVHSHFKTRPLNISNLSGIDCCGDQQSISHLPPSSASFREVVHYFDYIVLWFFTPSTTIRMCCSPCYSCSYSCTSPCNGCCSGCCGCNGCCGGGCCSAAACCYPSCCGGSCGPCC
ncbi:PREDICTED: uncharacterized protein LOC108620395 [Drosophila arizonae]|uniref:Uncharacterized protein LOC108620395 n=1 Tax=Drosophila arizonae TaxID=7263 RepID=A0ABM1Q005_DROAR|nr:PREDICTED: uncharacterized protein LOC108620395 [Drosophila arizonae]